MNVKKDILPVLIASGVALVITGIVRVLIPGVNSNILSSSASKKQTIDDVSMPDIPLMVKETKKEKEGQVLVTSEDIKSGSKIVIKNLTWKKWPQNAIQPYFIAKDGQGVAVNNKADYNNALKMWAASDIPSGIPLTMRMLINEDPKKKEEEARKKREKEEARKKQEELEKKRKDSTLRKGMRAVSVPIDQKSSVSGGMLNPGDRVDVLITDQRSGGTRIFKYTALKVLAIDGVSKIEDKPKKKINGNLLGGSVGGLLLPKNITLEVKEDVVEDMLRRLGNNGVTLSLRNQSDSFEKDEGKIVEESKEADSIVHTIARMNQTSSAEALKKKQIEKENEDKSLSILLDDINSAGNKNSRDELLGNEEQKRLDDRNTAMLIKTINSGGDKNSRDELLKNEEQKRLDDRNTAMLIKTINSSGDKNSRDELLGNVEQRRVEDRNTAMLIETINSSGSKNSRDELLKNEEQKRIEDRNTAMLIETINSGGSKNSRDELLSDREQKRLDERNAAMIIDTINSSGNKSSRDELLKNEEQKRLDERNAAMLIDTINSSGNKNSRDELLSDREQRRIEDRNTTMLIDTINSSVNNSKDALIESQKQKELNEANMAMIMKSMSSIENNKDIIAELSGKRLIKNARTGKYEIVSGKVVGDEPDEEVKSVVIYRKLRSDEVKFDESGKKLEKGSGEQDAGGSGDLGNSESKSDKKR
ncbi:MAG: hypothetical protein LBB21_05020 [Holosporaceae bacterium]|jgi:Flp pilus assembly protein CpaB|nr:hypothetical protein [Holosporaceae bacterium]